MATRTKTPEGKRSMNPMWVISIFVGLIEVTVTLGLTKTSGAVQGWLAAFVIVFPILLFGIFSAVLWKKSYLLYSPSEYRSTADAVEYIETIERTSRDIKMKAAEVEEILKRVHELEQQGKASIESITSLQNELRTTADELEKKARRYAIAYSSVM